MPHLRAAHGAAGTGRRILVRLTGSEGSERLSEQSAPTAASRRSAGTRIAIAACLTVLAAVGLQACGGSSVSEQVPKSTPNIIPPNNTSAEKAAISTTSTSTTATNTTSTSSESSSGSESSGSESSGSSGGTSEAGSSGGSAASESEKAATKEPEKTSEKAGGNSGGASAP